MAPSADSSHPQTLPMRWCIFVDILGFSQLWEAEQLKALHALRELMGAIHRIGTRVYPDEGERLFVHHMGDGFAIVSDFGEASFERPLGIAFALMRHMASTGTFAAAAVAEGEFSDITGCYPEEVMKDCEDGHLVRLSAGLMTLSPVMGTAFIRAYRLHVQAPSGPFVIVSEEHAERVPGGFELRSVQGKEDSNLLSIDWVRAESPTVARIQGAASLRAPKAEELVQAIRSYCAEYPSVRGKWSGHMSTAPRSLSLLRSSRNGANSLRLGWVSSSCPWWVMAVFNLYESQDWTGMDSVSGFVGTHSVAPNTERSECLAGREKGARCPAYIAVVQRIAGRQSASGSLVQVPVRRAVVYPLSQSFRSLWRLSGPCARILVGASAVGWRVLSVT